MEVSGSSKHEAIAGFGLRTIDPNYFLLMSAHCFCYECFSYFFFFIIDDPTTYLILLNAGAF